MIAVPAELRVGITEDDEGAAGTGHASRDRQEVPAIPIRRWRLHRTSEQVAEQVLRGRARPPQVSRAQIGDQGTLRRTCGGDLDEGDYRLGGPWSRDGDDGQ